MEKQACKSLPLARKVEILEEVKAAKLSKAANPRKFGIAKSTLSGIVKDEKKILDAYNDGDFAPKRKRMRTAAHGNLEAVLIAWIRRARSDYLPVNGTVLRAKAEGILQRLNIDFSCSDGWLDRFRKRHELVFRSIVGEAATVDKAACDDWRLTKMTHLLEEYEPGDIYNDYETALYYQLLPKKMLSFVGGVCTGGKRNKLRITMLLGANMSGIDKLRLLVIGKAKSPRCFKNVKTLPALIHTRLTYHLPYHNLTQTEHTRMSVLLRKAQKLALGLPVRTATVCLERLGVTNTLEELMEAHRAAQLTRLRCTAQGRALLATLGFPPCPATLAAEGLSPAARARLTVAPIPRHMNPTRHSARRDHRSRYLRRAYPVGCDTVRALFTDASPQGVRGGITVVVDSDLRTVHAATKRGLTDVSILEERAVARAILSTSLLSSSMLIHILTDSQTACRHFLYNTLHPSTASLLDPFLSSTSHNFRLIWVPGHAAVPGNERAHALARDLSHRAPGEDVVNIQPAPYSYSTQLAELRLARQHYPPPHPSLTRRDAVIWRQLQTNTFPTPLFYSYLHRSLSPPQCPHCGDRPNLFHMVWLCQLIPAVPPNSNPTPTSWEERLTDDTATGQQSLVDRAKAVAATYGAPD
ncbi:hypothetical protein ISCGN_008909 [Ixodes scapularis]